MVMEIVDIEARLLKNDIKPTPNRVLVFKALAECDRTMSLLDLETALPTLDRSSIFRVLTLFVSRHLVHSIEDGSGAVKYEVCGADEECSIADMHIHFHCERCGRTYCFEDIHVPTVELPSGFEPHAVNYMVKGICHDCKSVLRPGSN